VEYTATVQAFQFKYGEQWPQWFEDALNRGDAKVGMERGLWRTHMVGSLLKQERVDFNEGNYIILSCADPVKCEGYSIDVMKAELFEKLFKLKGKI